MGETVAKLRPTDGVTKIYLHSCDGSCQSRYSRFADHDSEQNDLTDSLTEVPIVHHHFYHAEKWHTENFIVQSPAMRAHLQVALADYPDFDLDLEDWTFRAPFEPLVHRWDRLNALCEETADPQGKEAIQQLMDFLRPILAPSIKAVAQTRDSGKISFNDVWQIFPPNQLVVTAFFGVDTICRVVKYKHEDICGRPPYWIVTLEYVDWNGETCGYATTTATIKSFKGARFVTSFPVFPLSFSESAAQIKQRIMERGRKFESLRGYHFRSCVGTQILLQTEQPEERPV